MVRVIASFLEFCALLSESEVLHRKVIIIFAIDRESNVEEKLHFCTNRTLFLPYDTNSCRSVVFSFNK